MEFQEFQYVVERKEQEKICFLSGKARFPPKKEVPKKEKLSKKRTEAEESNLELLDKPKVVIPNYLTPDKISGVNKVLNKVRSIRGVGGLADLSERFQKMRLEQIPPPNQYNIDYKRPTKECKQPFGKSMKICRLFASTTPGPGTYLLPHICRRPVKTHTFGGRMRLKPAVEVLCVPYPKDECLICQKICDGDYWHLDYNTFLCLKCMQNQRHSRTRFRLVALQEFKKIRNCSYMHRHEQTTAAIRLLPKRDICLKFRKENYLDLYFNKYI